MHTHFTSWPDFDVPTQASRHEFSTLINECADFVMKDKNPVERLVVHCKAGIGRTGTTIALVNLEISKRLGHP